MKIQPFVTWPGRTTDRTGDRRFYLGISAAMGCTVLAGFWLTYFGPVFRGSYPEVSPLVHVHGWSFFAWYVLLPVQAGMIRSGKVALHRTLGLASVALAVLMIVVGLIVSLVLIDTARAPEPDPFAELMGLPIFATWVVFTAFYVEAIRRRRRVGHHKRLILLASAAPLGSAIVRILAPILGSGAGVSVGGSLAATLFPVFGVMHDRRNGGRLHPVYMWGIPAMVLIIGGAYLVGDTAGGEVMARGLAWVGRALRPLY